MAAASLEDIRAGIAANLSATFSPSVNISPYQLETVMPPLIEVVGLLDTNYDLAAASGVDELMIAVDGFPGPISRGAQIVMDTWLARGATSVKNAIETDRTLGGIVHDCFVMSASGQKPQKNTDGTVLLNCEWRVRVLNKGP